MKNIKTFEEFDWKFWKKDELSPDQIYQKQKREAQKEAEKIKNNKNYVEEEDPYGEEVWDDNQIKKEINQNRRQDMMKRTSPPEYKDNPRKRRK